MIINVLDPFFQTALFLTFFVACTFLTIRKDPKPHEMTHSHTNELKGIAILMVIFCHIGYFLFSDHRFLYPVSVAGGVGVNIFLFLSGFGLTISEIRSEKPILQFYIKRLKNIFIPLWLVLIPILVLDTLILGKTYSLTTIIQSFLGFFPGADIYSALNSPLWYFTLILFYYLIFPLVFRKKTPLLSIALVFLLGFVMTSLKLPVPDDVLKLYKLHYLAFPLGMAFAYLDIRKYGAWFKNLLLHLSSKTLATVIFRIISIVLLLLIFGYTAIHSGVGGKVMTEQLISMITMTSLILVLLIKSYQSNLLITLGKYSYEIYLIQWPLMYRYDFIYKHTPAFLGTLIYIALFLAIGFILNKIAKLIKGTDYKVEK